MRRAYFNRLVFVAITFVLFTAVFAYGEDERLEEITVTATKTPRKVQDVSASVEVVTAETVRKSKGWNTGELIGGLPGVQAETKNGGYDTHIIIRGAGSKAAYGVREIMVMVDGVPITDPDSLTRFDMVDTALIEKIEVVKGPNSTLYGANAAGGIINIITKSPLQYSGLSLRAGYGSYNSQDYHLQYGGGVKNLYYLLSGSRRASDGWRDHNNFETNQAEVKLNYLIDEGSDVAMTFSYTKADLQLPGGLTKEQFEADPTQKTSEWSNASRDSNVYRTGVSYKKEFSGGNELKTQLYAHWWEHYHPVPIRINDGGAVVTGGEVQDNIPHAIKGIKGLLTVGVSGQKEDRDSEAYSYRDMQTSVINGKKVAVAPYSTSDEKGDLMETQDNTVTKWGVYLQESLHPVEDAVLDMGVRYDSVKFDINEELLRDWVFVTGKSGVSYFNYAAKTDTVQVEKTWSAVSPRVGLTYGKSVNGYVAVATGFQTPAESELGTNNDLEPQRTVNYEAGLRGRADAGHSIDLAFFYTTIDEEIIKLMDPFGVNYYDNAGETLHKGIEASGKLKLVDGLFAGASYSYSDFTFVRFDEMEKKGAVINVLPRDGNQLPLIPAHKFSTSLEYGHSSGAYVRAGSDTWGEYYVDTANSETYEGFTVYKARVGYDGKTLGLYLQGDNLLDTKYAAEVTSSYGKTSYYPGAPRTLMAGATYKF